MPVTASIKMAKAFFDDTAQIEDIGAFMLIAYWAVLSKTSACHVFYGFRRFLPNQSALADAFKQAQIVFAPGLLEVLQCDTPPTQAWYMSLPNSKTWNVWGVYILILEKEGHPPLVYCGSATCSTRGVSIRWWSYDKLTLLPGGIEAAIAQGYRITYKGLLCWSLIPNSATLLTIRALFLVLETALTVCVGIMNSKFKLHGMPMICPWPLDSLPCQGLCSHLPVTHHIPGVPIASNLTNQQLEHEADVKRQMFLQRQKERKAAHQLEVITMKLHYCEVCDMAFPCSARLQTHLGKKTHADALRGKFHAPSGTGDGTKYANKNRAKKLFFCHLCDYNAGSSTHFNAHIARPKHLKRKAELTAIATGKGMTLDEYMPPPPPPPPPKPKVHSQEYLRNRPYHIAALRSHKWHCTPCGYSAPTAAILRRHQGGITCKAKCLAEKILREFEASRQAPLAT